MLLNTKRLSVALSYYALHYKIFVKRMMLKYLYEAMYSYGAMYLIMLMIILTHRLLIRTS